METSTDFVIRDKHGRLVRDLQPNDLQITDDGRPVKLGSLRSGKDLSTHRYFSLLLDGDDATRALALTALNELTRNSHSEGTYVSLWEVHNKVRLFHNFSNNFASLRKCLTRSKRTIEQSTAVKDTSSDTERVAADRSAEQTLLAAKRLIQQQQLRPVIAALLALAIEQRQLPGRKTIVLFSDGMQLNTITEDSLRFLVSEANRSQVSFYTVNASGISGKAKEQESRFLIDSMGVGTSLSSVAQQADQMGATTTWNRFSQSRQSGPTRLQGLAAQTGGSYGGGMVGLRKFIRNVVEDSLEFREATYLQPLTKQQDNHFRSTVLRSSVPGQKIQARAGSFAVTQFEGKEISPFEAPLLAALQTRNPEETISFTTSLVRTGQQEKQPLMKLLVDVPLSGLMAKESDTANKFSFHLSVLALLKDAEGKIVQKFSRDVKLEGALEQLSETRRQGYRFEFPVILDPGKYSLDAALEDGFAKKISAKGESFSFSGQEPVIAAKPQGASATSPLFARDADSETADVSPEIFSAPIIRKVAPPREVEQGRIIEGARRRVLVYKENLPNFICTMVTQRFVNSRSNSLWEAVDSSVEILTYLNGKETVTPIDAGHSQEGASVKGEFGELLTMPFSSKSKASISWEGEAEIMGARTAVFRFTVQRPNSDYLLIGTQANDVTYAAYHALVFIDARTLGVRRVAITADNLPEKFSLQDSQVIVDYDYLPVHGNEYLLPVHASLFVRQRGRKVRRNDIDFQNYRKYGADSRLIGP